MLSNKLFAYQKPILVILLTSLLAASGCGVLWMSDPASEGDGFQVSKKGVAAATGAAVGAGLGAIVGSQSGHAAAGVAIGGLAGAAAGGLVGYELDKQDQDITSGEQSLTEQRETITSQKAQLGKLRNSASDSPGLSFFNAPSSRSGSFAGGTYHGNPRAVPWNVAKNTTLEEKRLPTLRAAVKPLAKKNHLSPHQVVHLQKTMPQTLANNSVKHLSETSLPAGKEVLAKSGGADETSGLPKAKTVSSDAEPVTIENDSPASAPLDSAPLKTVEKTAPPDNIATNSNSEGTVLPLASADGENCGKAAEEAMHARSSSSNADKLFYFRRALRLCSKKSDYHLEIGRIYAEIGRKEDAQFEFHQVLDIEPANLSAKQELAKIGGELARNR